MSVYLIATIEVKAGGLPRLSEAIGAMIPLLATAGWRLASAYTLRTGQLGTVVDVWELPDHNALNAGLAAVGASPEFAGIQAILQDVIIKETLSFADRLVYPGQSE